MTSFGDGYQQIQDPCAAVSNFVENYNVTELYQSFQTVVDPADGTKLLLFQFDGSPVAPQLQVSSTPNMLPLQSLRNVTGATTTTTTTTDGLTTANNIALTGGAQGWSGRSVFGAITASMMIGFASFLL